MADLPLDLTLIVDSGDIVYSGSFDGSLDFDFTLDPLFLDVTVYTNARTPLPKDVDCIPFDASLDIENLDSNLTVQPQLIDFTLDTRQSYIDVQVEIVDPSILPDYEGPYVIEPRKVEQQFETKDHKMTDDLTVNKIYYSKVTNPEGGYTVYIGRE